MTFEEKKQKLLKKVEELEKCVRDSWDTGKVDENWYETSDLLKKLQPDQPMCSTCKYYSVDKGFDIFPNLAESKCLNKYSPLFFKTKNLSSIFGCIYHEKA